MKKFFTVNGKEIQFETCTAIWQEERIPALYIHQTDDVYKDGDGIIFDECLPTNDEEAETLLEECATRYETDSNILESVIMEV